MIYAIQPLVLEAETGQGLELAVKSGVLYGLLEAANPNGLTDLKAGKMVSLGNQCRQEKSAICQQPALGNNVVSNLYDGMSHVCKRRLLVSTSQC